MRKGRLQKGIGVFVGILVMVSFPTGIIWREVYLEKLNYRLLTAVKANDTHTVIDLLARGADANTHDDPPRKASMWQTLLEALHLRQKSISNAPSALRLAFEWRPKPDSAIKPTIEDTPLIRALMSHGALLNGPEIVARMTRTYAFCSSYQDTGNLSLSNPSEHLSFRTAFVRPGRFYFEYTQPPSGHCIIWARSGNAHAWFAGKSQVEDTSLDMAIAGATGVSLGAADMIPSLLFPEELGGWVGLETSYSQARRKGIQQIDGISCYEIVPADRTITALYIDTKTFLVRKVVEAFPTASDQEVTLYHPQVNVPIRDSTFQVKIPQ